MDLKIKTWLLDIDHCINEIFDFIGEDRNFLNYKKDLKTKKAVERNIEIIGEAVGRILKFDSKFLIKNAQHIIGIRNRIIHSYDNISDEIIWTIIIKELPILKVEIENHLLKE
nr:DUF86 domain-containing protein [Pseudopedobacter sp.]